MNIGRYYMNYLSKFYQTNIMRTEKNKHKSHNKLILNVLIVFIVLFVLLFSFQWYSLCNNLKEYKLEKESKFNSFANTKTNLIDVTKLEKSKNLIIIKKEDLIQINENINSLAEEIYNEKNKAASIIDKDIDRLNLYMAIGIGFIAIIGIFVPVITNYLSYDDIKEKIKDSTKNIAEVDELKDKLNVISPKVSTISLQIALNRINNMTSTAIKNIRLHEDNSLFDELFKHLKEELSKCKEDKNHSISENKPLIEALKDFVLIFNDEKIRFVSILNKKGLDLEFDNLSLRLQKLIKSNKEDEEKIYEEINSTIDKILNIFKKKVHA